MTFDRNEQRETKINESKWTPDGWLAFVALSILHEPVDHWIFTKIKNEK